MGADYDLVILNWRVMDPETRLDDVRNVGVKHGRAFSIQTYEQAIKDGLAVDLAKYLTLRWSKSAQPTPLWPSSTGGSGSMSMIVMVTPSGSSTWSMTSTISKLLRWRRAEDYAYPAT